MKSSTTETKKPHSRNSLACVTGAKRVGGGGGGGEREKSTKEGKREGVSTPLSPIPSLFSFLPISLSTPATQAKIPMWVTRTLFMGRAKLDMWDITDSNVDLFVYLIEELENSTIELGLISRFPHCWLTRVRLIDRVTK